MLLNKIDKNNIPQHIAIIMDGNGRWAKSKGLTRTDGHREGVTSIRSVLNAAINANIKCLTLFAFSTENWDRPKEEVNELMSLIISALKNELPEFLKQNIRLETIGNTELLPEKAQLAINECIARTNHCNKITLVIALSYSGKKEISETAKKISIDLKKELIKEEDINEKLFSSYLNPKKFKDVDLLIRTGGEKRISNFLLWQSAYSELYFTDILWPSFREENLYEAIIDYQTRERRFGKISEQL